MYIYLENDLADLDLSLDENGELLDFLCDFIYKSFKGKFILDGKKALRNTSKYIVDQRLQAKINFIIQRNMEYKNLFNSLSFKLSISKNYNKVDRSEGVVKIPLDTLLGYDFENIDFVTEDFNDSDYLDQAMRSFQLVRDDLKIFRINYNKINGGGRNTPNVYEYYLKKNSNYVVCLCDSDRFSPGGPDGDNARECKKILGLEDLSSLFITDGREIENDIPYSLIEHAFLNDPKTLKNIRELPYYRQYICSNILKHADLKKGVTLQWVEKMKLNSENRKYWSVRSQFIMDNYWYKNKDDETILLVPSISEKVLKNVSLFLKKKNDTELKNYLLEHNASSNDDFYQFISLAEKLFWILFSFHDKKFVA